MSQLCVNRKMAVAVGRTAINCYYHLYPSCNEAVYPRALREKGVKTAQWFPIRVDVAIMAVGR